MPSFFKSFITNALGKYSKNSIWRKKNNNSGFGDLAARSVFERVTAHEHNPLKERSLSQALVLGVVGGKVNIAVGRRTCNLKII